MESGDNLDLTLAALGNISADDLDALLQDEILPPSNASDALLENAQKLSSQYSPLNSQSDISASEVRERDAIDRFETRLSSNNFENLSLAIIEDDSVEPITINQLATATLHFTKSDNELFDSNQNESNLLGKTFYREFIANEEKNRIASRERDGDGEKPSTSVRILEQSPQVVDLRVNAPKEAVNVACTPISDIHVYSTPISDTTSIPDSLDELGVPRNILGQQNTIPYACDASDIPQAIKKLFDLIKLHYSDLSFVYALSAQLCQDRVPMSCYVNVKMALLLSIASCAKNSNVSPIPIIVIGNDVYMANYLLMNIANLAARFVGPSDDTRPMSSIDKYRNFVWIEADPIQLAKGGIYYVGDWSCLKAARSEKIFKDIETSRVAIAQSTRVYPLQTAIWAHWRAFKYNAKDQQIFNKLVKVFGIPVCMDNRNMETMVDFMIKQASNQLFESTIDHLSVSADDMRKFLAIISERTVDVSAEANNLLRKYFIASRKERPDCLTKQAYPILKQLAESFAKLSLRHEVLTIDAVGAILMCENFLQQLYGPGIDPPPLLDNGNFVGDVDKHVARFNEWINDYIDKYCDKDI